MKSKITKYFGIPSNALSIYLKDKDKNLNTENCTGNLLKKKTRGSDYLDADCCFLNWIKQARDKNIPINGFIMSAKAK